jgi:hypothetical protein
MQRCDTLRREARDDIALGDRGGPSVREDKPVSRSVSESCLDTLLERPAWSAERGRLYRRPGQSQDTQACRAIEQPGAIGCRRETGLGAPYIIDTTCAHGQEGVAVDASPWSARSAPASAASGCRCGGLGFRPTLPGRHPVLRRANLSHRFASISHRSAS